LSRIGASLVFHGASCPLVTRYGLSEIDYNNLAEKAIPCLECDPDESTTLVFPEKDRFWAQVSDSPAAVLDALYKYDDGGARYLTNVAQRLLDTASKIDNGIFSVYNVEIIP
jgi:hypothetical protein